MGIRVLLVLSFVGLMLIGCSEADQPSAAEAPAERQAVEPEQEGEASEVVRTTSRVQVDATQPQQATNEPQQQPSDQTGSDSEPPPTREEPRSPSQSEAEQQGEPTESQEEPESPPTDLTDVPATVIKDADVRVRPGLPWPVIERLSAGDEVVILNVATGWYRISYGDEREGWIRTTALDLGVVEPHRILHRPAPAIVAEWRGEQYGVMGQSADGAEVRLLPMDEELAEIVGAPINEVTLLADDITVRDLPILIGDETVVFAGDDFRVGLGRILPKANEWMWLPWGWLLAHNDSHIWQWRPETDELEFIQRTPGQAALSADGRHLAILSCGGVESCHPVEDVTIMPLDGSPIVSLRGLLNRAGGLHEEKRIELIDTYDLSWSPDGSSLLVGISEGAGIQGLSAVLFDASGAMTLFEWEPEGPLADKDCFPNRYPFRPRYELWQYWAFSSQDDVRIRVICTEDDELVALWAAYGSGGEFHRLEPDPELQVPASDEFAMIAADADQLGDDTYELGDGTDRYSIVVEPQLRKLFIYDEGENQIREVNDDPYVMPDWLWELLERGPGVGYQG